MEDKYEDRSSMSVFLVQRFAMAMVYFELGGASRWKTCWSGKRYVNFDTDDVLSSSTSDNDDDWDDDNDNDYNNWMLMERIESSECHHELYNNSMAWLTSVHECDWAFVDCDRDQFVTSIEMGK